MEVKTFIYKKLLGTYYWQGVISSKKMDTHIAEMLSQGWQIASQSAHSGDRRLFRSKQDTITITFTRA